MGSIVQPSKPRRGASGASARSLSERRAEGTLIDVVQMALRGMILAGIYKPGQRLPITTFAREQGVSLGVVREALTRLAVDRLVTSEPMQGFSVVQTSVKDLDELTELLLMVIKQAVRKSVKNGGGEWEARVVAAHHLFKRAVKSDQINGQRSAELDSAHSQFLDALISACDNARLIDLVTTLERSMALYHRLAIELLKNSTTEQELARYDTVVQYAIDGNADGAAQLMLEDIIIATDACRDFINYQRHEPPK